MAVGMQGCSAARRAGGDVARHWCQRGPRAVSCGVATQAQEDSCARQLRISASCTGQGWPESHHRRTARDYTLRPRRCVGTRQKANSAGSRGSAPHGTEPSVPLPPPCACCGAEPAMSSLDGISPWHRPPGPEPCHQTLSRAAMSQLWQPCGSSRCREVRLTGTPQKAAGSARCRNE